MTSAEGKRKLGPLRPNLSTFLCRCGRAVARGTLVAYAGECLACSTVRTEQ
jgi:hypothetical protein